MGKGKKKQKKKVEWSVFSQVSGSQVAPALTGNESLQVPVLSRCCAMRGTCPESRPECSSPGQEQRGEGGGRGECIQTRNSLSGPCPSDGPGRVCSSSPGSREQGGGRGCLPGKDSLGRGGEFPASGPWGELQAGGVSKAQRTQEAQWRRRRRWGGG